MNIKSKISKLVSGLLCFSMIFSNVLPAYATDATITENTLDGEDLSVNERNLEDVTVTYKQASSFFVTIPKTIVLDGWKQSTYAVKVSGDIDSEQCVYVAPVDGIADTENIDFYMKDQAPENAKDDVVASVTHKKSHWNATEVAAGYKQDDNLVSAPDLTAGAWRGIFQMEIKLETHVTHKHNYVETITKEPTCTETGEKTYSCDCGDSYTEEIPATGHNYVDGVCDKCGDLNLKAEITTLFSASASTSAGTEAGHGHYDTTNLSGTYSDEIEITEDMGEDDYLQLYFAVTRPSTVSGSDPVSGSSMLQKYDEETNTWETIYSYSMSYSNLTDFSMRNAEGGGGNGNTEWINRKFQLEKGKYRVYGQFSAKVSCGSRVQHYFWYYRITASLCKIELDTETP